MFAKMCLETLSSHPSIGISLLKNLKDMTSVSSICMVRTEAQDGGAAPRCRASCLGTQHALLAAGASTEGMRGTALCSQPLQLWNKVLLKGSTLHTQLHS